MKAKAIKLGWSLVYFVAGMLLLLGMWDMVSRITKGEIPSPIATWGTFKEVMTNPFQNDPDYKGIAEKLILDDLYAEVAKEMGVPVQADMQVFKTTYDVQFDPNNAGAYLKIAKR